MNYSKQPKKTFPSSKPKSKSVQAKLFSPAKSTVYTKPPKPSAMVVTEKNLKPSNSFFRVTDGSWVNLFTNVDHDTGVRSGTIYSGRLSDSAIPLLAEAVQEEMNRRKLDFVKAIHADAEDDDRRQGKKPNAQKIVDQTTPLNHGLQPKKTCLINVVGKDGIVFAQELKTYKDEDYVAKAVPYKGGKVNVLVRMLYHTMDTFRDTDGKDKHYWSVSLKVNYEEGGQLFGTLYPLRYEEDLTREKARGYAMKWMKGLSVKTLEKCSSKLDSFYTDKMSRSDVSKVKLP